MPQQTLPAGIVSRRWTPYVALALSLLFTTLMTAYLLWAASTRDEARFERLTSEVEANIQSLVNTYIALLRAGEGFVSVNEETLTREAFGEFVAALELEENYPGVQGIGYTKRVPKERIDEYTQKFRARGAKGLEPWPPTDEDYVHTIVFLEPLDRRNFAAIGFNMHSEPVRRAAMDEARDTGEAVLTGRVTLVQEIDEKKQAGFLIYNPIYQGNPTTVTERFEKLLGYVYSPFRGDDFFRGVHDPHLMSQLDFAVYAGTEIAERNLLHDSAKFQKRLEKYHPQFSSTLTMMVGGHPWTIVFRSRPEFHGSLSREFAWGGFVVGALFSILIFLLARSQSRGWRKAEEWGERLIVSQRELEESEARLRLHVEELEQAETRIVAAAERSQILSDASRAFAAAALDKRAVARVATDAVVNHLGDLSAVDLFTEEGDKLFLAAISHRNPAMVEKIMPLVSSEPEKVEATIFRNIIQEKKAVFMPQVDPEALRRIVPAERYRFLDTVKIHSAMAVPLVVQGRILGAIGAVRHGETEPYTQEDFFILEELAARVALAVDNASLYERAQSAIRLRDEFLSIASHELKTPLTPLQLQLQGLQRLLQRSQDEPIPPERLWKVAEVTQRQVERLTGLINNLLDISRISAGRLAFEPEECDLVSITRDVTDRFQVESERRDVPIHLQVPEGPVIGNWDRLRLEQVVTNLVSNAFKYGAGKPVSLEIRDEGAFAELHVVDQGIGLDPQFRGQLFQRFSRGVSGRDISGLGLGLYIVKQNVDGHGGTIEASSNKGEGTRFTVRLPKRPPYSGGEAGQV